ncbi:MAG: triose-phosphate isomerase [Candidatus Edwardsbacteria bacterium]|jgi:triosephosphate isomerase|nr:triose-phosphate isomerase [Candidatus Edwardsbacteria bacterium]
MRTPIMAGNWKMHKTAAEATALAAGIVEQVREVTGVEVVLCPPFTALGTVAEAVKGTTISLGAQNCHYEAQGAFTGEVSPNFLLDFGCKYVIIAHSERRQHFGEDDALINRKLKAVLGLGLVPVFCVGESLEQREKDLTFDVLRKQVLGGLAGIQVQDPSRLVVAYEPVWAIGTGKVATPQQAQEAHRYLRDLLAGLWGTETAEGVRLQYGGSVKPDNVRELMACPDIDGALVGGASLDAGSFARIVRFQ